MSLWEKQDPVLGELLPTGVRRVLRGGLWQPQRDWWELQNFIRLLVGGYGSGKTRTLCKWMIAGALHNAPSWSAIVSANFPLARRTVIPTLIELLDGKCALRSDMTYRHNKSDHCFTIEVECRPPATLLYLSGDDPDNLKGPNLGQVGIDEPFIQDRRVFDQMMFRLRDPAARLIAMGLAGTPEDLNWGYDISEGDERGKYDIGVVHAPTSSNAALPESYLPRLRRAFDDKAAAAYLEGRFVSLASGQVFYAFDHVNNVRDAKDEGVGAAWFCGMDFNVNPMSVTIGWHRGETIHFEDEFELPNANTEYAVSLVRERYPVVRVCYPDPTGKARNTNAPVGVTDMTIITQGGLIPLAPRQPWPRRDSFNAVNAKLDKRQLTFSPRCRKLIHYMRQYAHERMKQQEEMSHLLDAMRYPVTYLFPIHRPTTAVHAISA